MEDIKRARIIHDLSGHAGTPRLYSEESAEA